MNSRDIQRFAAVIPDYRDGAGQGISIYFRDGTTGWVCGALRSFLLRLAGEYTVDVQEMRRKYGPLLGQKNLVPLVLAPHLIYVPIKSRSPRVAGDPAYGYYRLRSVLSVSHSHPCCELSLEGGHEVKVVQSYRTVKQRLASGRKLENMLMDDWIHALDMDGFRPAAPSAVGEVEPGLPHLLNLAEVEVRACLSKLLASMPAVCACEHCRKEMEAHALNQLPPRYVVLVESLSLPDCDFGGTVAAAVSRAASVLQKKPGHEIIH